MLMEICVHKKIECAEEFIIRFLIAALNIWNIAAKMNLKKN